MKRLLLFGLLCVSFSVTAQLTIVKDVSATGVQPAESDQFLWQNNLWNGKRYYCVQQLPSVALAVTDGTNAGTKIIKNFGYSGVSSATIKAIVSAQDHFYIHVSVNKSFNPYIMYDELWKSDGTEAGTVLLKRFDERGITAEGIMITTDQYEANNRSLSGNEMYFNGYTGNGGRKIWKTDGTAAGTVLVADKSANAFTRLNGEVYFISDFKLWKISGANNSIEMINVPNIFMVSTFRMAAFKNKLYFMGFDETNGVELWTSDGTPSGTKLFVNTSPLTNNVYSLTSFMLVTTDDYLLFSTLHNESMNTRHTLYKTDGTIAGTVQISPVDALDAGSSSGSMFSKTNELFHCFNLNQRTIFRSNYQEGGHSIVPLGNYMASNLVDYKGTAWYSGGTTSMSGNNDFAEPHRSDGLQDIKTFDLVTMMQGTNNVGSNPFGFHEQNGKLYFFAGLSNSMKLYEFQGDFTFNRSAGNSWNNAANWNAGITPLSSEDVVIPAGSDIEISSSASSKNLQVNAPLNISAGSLNVSGNLNLNSKITLNNNSLNLKGTSSTITNGNATNYVVTNGTGTVNIESLDGARGTLNLPIGTVANYNPVSINNSGVSDSFSVKVSDGIANTTNGAVNATWDISEGTAGGSNVNLSLTWNANQENAGFERNSASVGHYVNGGWSAENSGMVSGSNPYSISATGITTFSPFAVINLGALGTSDSISTKNKIYPNPFKDQINFEVQEDSKVVFYDVAGRQVLSKTLKKGKNTLYPDILNKGLYLYQIQNVKGEIFMNGKLIKN